MIISPALSDSRQYFITPVSAINFKEEEIEIPMGDGTSGHYAAQLKSVRKDTFTFLQMLT